MFPFGGPDPTRKPLSACTNIHVLKPVSTAQTMNYTVVINMAVWGGCLLYYAVNARHWFKGPKITLNLQELTPAQEQVLIDEGLVIDAVDVPTSTDKASEGITKEKPEE
jgi:hypothetical protein